MVGRGPYAVLVILSIFLAGCYNLFEGLTGSSSDDRPSAEPARVIEPAEKYSLAIGGVAPGRDELVIYDGSGDIRDFSGQTLACTADDDIVIVRPRPGFETAAEGSGVGLIATAPGVTAIRCAVDGIAMEDAYEVTIPPQMLIQILIAEAGQQIDDEAQLGWDAWGGSVLLNSSSPTGNAIGQVIRNRIELINSRDNPALFNADESDYDYNPPASYYDAVIMADGQFSPVDPDDPTYDIFDSTQDRNFLDDEWLVAYDQAVLTAAGVFNGDTDDTTAGAFAFRSPTDDEWDAIAQAWTLHHSDIPDGAGFSDETFPSLAPIQILIHPDVWTYGDGRPAFVFARRRTEDVPAVVNTP